MFLPFCFADLSLFCLDYTALPLLSLSLSPLLNHLTQKQRVSVAGSTIFGTARILRSPISLLARSPSRYPISFPTSSLSESCAVSENFSFVVVPKLRPLETLLEWTRESLLVTYPRSTDAYSKND